jgi:hypothetical protein
MENRPPQLEPTDSCLYAAVERTTMRRYRGYTHNSSSAVNERY